MTQTDSPERAMQRREQEAREILRQAIAEYDPCAIYACFSGGHDSLCPTHMFMGIAEQVLHINTGIGIEKTREFVRDTCNRHDWPLKEVHPPQMTYREMVLKFGFPGPGMHYLPYRLLKERALRQVVREAKRKTRDRVMFITGVRQSESARRMGHVEPVVRVGSQVWVAPIWDWSKRDCNEYIEANNLPRNEVVDLLHMSGECLCGAFARRGELKEINLWFPETAKKIYALEEEAKRAEVHCQWGVRPPRDTYTRQLPFQPLCVGCDASWRPMSVAERGKTERKQQPEPEPRLVTKASLCAAWRRYQWLFGDVPHGTENQLAALLELIPKVKP